MIAAIDIAQALGWAAALVGAVSFQARRRETVIVLLAVSCLLWTTHFAALGMSAGAIFNFIALLRGLMAMLRHPWVRRGVLGFIPLIWAVAVLTAKQPIDYIPPLAMTMSTLAQASTRVVWLRLFMGLSSPPWLTYSILAGSQGGVANELLNMGSVALSLYRYHLRPRLAARAARRLGRSA